ncbi:hypothetical protein [Nocardia alba]|uniref:hypothetical protein n=1 Tax=Nocardia alba TaxID=225051 RepID=UPI00082EAD48|nr:hypothetical protein [Nocardia alba]
MENTVVTTELADKFADILIDRDWRFNTEALLTAVTTGMPIAQAPESKDSGVIEYSVFQNLASWLKFVFLNQDEMDSDDAARVLRFVQEHPELLNDIWAPQGIRSTSCAIHGDMEFYAPDRSALNPFGVDYGCAACPCPAYGPSRTPKMQGRRRQYCSSACRQRAYRERMKLRED